MKHRILMMGGRRAGKSSILSSVLYSLKEEQGSVRRETGFDYLFNDCSDYLNQFIETPRGKEPIPSLEDKMQESIGYINNHMDMKGQIFTVDMNPTYGKATYSVRATITSKSQNATGNSDPQIEFDFVDVPGEWMKVNATEKKVDGEIINNHKLLEDEIKNCDVFIIAIDTPFLMEESKDKFKQKVNVQVNNIYNRIDAITDSLVNNVRFGGDENNDQTSAIEDRKLILLCPVKCEKWALNGQAEEVKERVKVAYDTLITRFVNDPRVDIEIMPIITSGGLESAKLLPKKLLYKEENQEIGKVCSIDPATGLILLEDGKVLRRKDQYDIVDDESVKINSLYIPLSWYRVNGLGYEPKFCEQPAYHIIEFLLKKEEYVIKTKAEIESGRLKEMWPFTRWLTRLFHPTFGKYLPKFKDFISALNQCNLIKRTGDGFEIVKSRSSRVIG